MASCYRVLASVLVALLMALAAAAPALSAADDEDLDLLDLDLEDPQPAAHHSPSSVVSLAQQRKALIELSDYTAPVHISEHEFVLLLGYAPWCTRSAELMPEYAAAALLLQDAGIPVSVAKIDGNSQTHAAAAYGIKGFPSLYFFVNGTKQRYTGGFTRNEIAVWVKKRTGLPAQTVSSTIEAEEVLHQNGTTVVGYFEDFTGPDYEAFISAAKEELETEFVQVKDTEVITVLTGRVPKVEPFMCILKSKPETYVPYDSQFDKHSILWFVEVNKHPLLTEIDRHNYMKLYASPLKVQVTLFTDVQSSKEEIQLAQDVAKIFKGQLLFLLADTADEELSRPTLTLFGLEPQEPIVTAFNYDNGLKYLLESELTKDNLMEFCKRLAAGKQPPYYKSQAIPTEERGDVQIVVGKNFESVVLDESKDVFLEVYTPWCIRCDAANKAFDAVGKQLKDIPTLVVAKIDAAANEHPLLQVDDYPEFLYYPANNKTNPVAAPQKWSTKKLVQFAHEHAMALIPPSHADKDEL